MARSIRFGIVTAALGALVAGTGVLATSATAATAPVVKVVAGNRMLTVAWKPVAGAKGYTVRWKGVDHQVASSLHQTIGGLTNGQKTAVRVTANGVTGASTLVSGIPSSGYPLAITGMTAVPGRGDTITVKVAGGGRARWIGIIAGGDSTTKAFHFHTRWYEATKRTFTVTVPSSKLSALGRRTGNYVYVKAVQTNSLTTNPVMHLNGDVSEAYRVSSPPGTRALAGVSTLAATAAVSQVTVGELNVQSLTATKRFTKANQWIARAPRVAKTVIASHPDLFLTAELTTTKLDATCLNHPSAGYWCPTQHSDLAKRLKAGAGYAEAFPDAEARLSNFVTTHDGYAGATFGTHIFYNPTKLSLGAHGAISPRATLGVSPWSGPDRWLSWAVMTVKSSGKRFVAVAAHFPAGESQTYVDMRADEARKLVDYLDTKAGGLPIVVAGDFNADPVFAPNPNMRILIGHGYADSGATPKRVGARYNTFNGRNGSDGDDPGYPDTVHPYKYSAPRIDFIMTKNSPYAYGHTNVLHFASGSSTVLDPNYRGSDHLLQLATIGIGEGVPSS